VGGNARQLSSPTVFALHVRFLRVLRRGKSNSRRGYGHKGAAAPEGEAGRRGLNVIGLGRAGDPNGSRGRRVRPSGQLSPSPTNRGATGMTNDEPRTGCEVRAHYRAAKNPIQHPRRRARRGCPNRARWRRPICRFRPRHPHKRQQPKIQRSAPVLHRCRDLPSLTRREKASSPMMVTAERRRPTGPPLGFNPTSKARIRGDIAKLNIARQASAPHPMRVHSSGFQTWTWTWPGPGLLVDLPAG
jgi:hypothetical protein